MGVCYGQDHRNETSKPIHTVGLPILTAGCSGGVRASNVLRYGAYRNASGNVARSCRTLFIALACVKKRRDETPARKIRRPRCCYRDRLEREKRVPPPRPADGGGFELDFSSFGFGSVSCPQVRENKTRVKSSSMHRWIHNRVPRSRRAR